jgi:hypothetical protein
MHVEVQPGGWHPRPAAHASERRAGPRRRSRSCTRAIVCGPRGDHSTRRSGA